MGLKKPSRIAVSQADMSVTIGVKEQVLSAMAVSGIHAPQVRVERMQNAVLSVILEEWTAHVQMDFLETHLCYVEIQRRLHQHQMNVMKCLKIVDQLLLQVLAQSTKDMHVYLC